MELLAGLVCQGYEVIRRTSRSYFTQTFAKNMKDEAGADGTMVSHTLNTGLQPALLPVGAR
jgi:hypothetical protein